MLDEELGGIPVEGVVRCRYSTRQNLIEVLDYAADSGAGSETSSKANDSAVDIGVNDSRIAANHAELEVEVDAAAVVCGEFDAKRHGAVRDAKRPV